MANIEERKTKSGETRYRALVRLKGFPPVSATFKRKTDARRWAANTEASMSEGRHFKHSEAKRHTVAQLIDRYIHTVIPTKPKNASACSAQLRWWKSQIGHTLLSDLTPAIIAEQRDKLGGGYHKARKTSLSFNCSSLPCSIFACSYGSDEGVGTD